MAVSDDFLQEIAATQAAFYHPDVQNLIREIEAVAGYRLSAQLRAPFLHFHAFITADPRPNYITAWRSEPPRERWYHRHVNGVLGHVQNAVACVRYHRDNLCAIEDAVRQIVNRSDTKAILSKTNLGIGLWNNVRFDAEYQAFVLAVRRCLDYLARAMAAYFQNDFHSFRDLPKFLENKRPVAVASKLADAHKRHEAKFGYVLSDGGTKSIRDLLSHYEYISAGALNINSRGVLVSAGGERLQPLPETQDEGLSPVIAKRADELHACVGDFLATFVASAHSEEAQTRAPGAMPTQNPQSSPEL